MNDTIHLLTSHRSYRHFDENYILPKEQLSAILAAARQAPSWMNGQMYSIIVIQDKKIREEMIRMNPGNPHILNSSVFLLFLADLKRTEQVAKENQASYQIGDGLNPLLIATTDASLALENALIAAESLGLGAVPVGSVRSHVDELKELLHLPDYVLPIAGLTIGKPTVEMKIKPRLPEQAVIHYDTYKETDYTLIEAYDETMEAFGEARETKRWSKKFVDYFAHQPSQKLDHFIKNQKLFDFKEKTDN